MTAATSWPWAALALLGAVHGLNPGMGWLFAVALGLQEKNRRAVWGALLPLAAGHALAIAAAIAVAAAAGLMVPTGGIRWIVAAMLLVLGVVRLRRHRHPRWVGMRVTARDLTLWSFLMASAHGAGLMALPFVLAATDPAAAGHHLDHGGLGQGAQMAAAAHAAAMAVLPPGAMAGVLATAAHTVGYLVVLVLMAVLVYERLGLRLLRTAWINLDLVWAGALTCTAVLTVLVG
jgi:hypothetical protein